MRNKVRQAYLIGLMGTGGPDYPDCLGSYRERAAYWRGDTYRLELADSSGKPQPNSNLDPDVN